MRCFSHKLIPSSTTSHKKKPNRADVVQYFRSIQHADLDVLDDAAGVLKSDADLVSRYQEYRTVRPFVAVKENCDRKLKAAQELQDSDYMGMVKASMKANQEAQEAIYKLYQSGQKVTESKEGIYKFYWQSNIQWALSVRDKSTAEVAYKALEKIAEEHPDLKVSLTNWKMQIASF